MQAATNIPLAGATAKLEIQHRVCWQRYIEHLLFWWCRPAASSCSRETRLQIPPADADKMFPTSRNHDRGIQTPCSKTQRHNNLSPCSSTTHTMMPKINTSWRQSKRSGFHNIWWSQKRIITQKPRLFC